MAPRVRSRQPVALARHRCDHTFFGQPRDHSPRFQLGPGLLRLLPGAAGVFRAGEGFLVMDQAKAVMDALGQDAPQPVVPFQHQDGLCPGFPGALGSGQAPRPAADDDHIILLFGQLHHFTLPTNRLEPLPR